MTAEPPEPGRPSADRTSASDGRGFAGALLRGGAPGRRLGNVLRRLASWPPISGLKAVLDAYATAGGGLLAAGLAFGALFAFIPATLLVLGVAGLFVADPHLRADVGREIAGRIPPLEGYVAIALDQVAAGAAGLSVVGLAGVAWAAARFYGQLDEAFGLVLGSAGRRGFLERTIRGLVAVGLLAAFYVMLAWVSILTAWAPGVVVEATGAALRLAGPLVYRIVPTQRLAWRAIRLPAVVVAVAEGLLTGSYVLIAPLLASPAVFGPFVTAFATLAWLAWTFQLLLLGAAWVRRRTDRPGADGQGSGAETGVSGAVDGAGTVAD